LEHPRLKCIEAAQEEILSILTINWSSLDQWKIIGSIAYVFDFLKSKPFIIKPLYDTYMKAVITWF